MARFFTFSSALALALTSIAVAGCPASDVRTDTDGGGAGIDAGHGIDGGPSTDAGPGVDGGGPGVDGGAVVGCTSGQVLCGAVCTDLSSDVANCGGCGDACGGGAACVAGTCGGAVTCPPGTLDCGGDCRDVSGDPEFCGSCTRNLCAADEFCVDGACTCRPGLSACGAACVDVMSDPANCGACGAPCATVCTGGICGAASACTLEVCGGACIDTETDVRHCGGCDSPCDVDQICITGNCEDYEPAPGCTSCGACDTCPTTELCCELPVYGASCVDAPTCP